MLRRAETRRETAMDDEALAIQLFAEETRHLTDRVTDRSVAPRAQGRGFTNMVRQQPSQRTLDGHGEPQAATSIVTKVANRFGRNRSNERPAAGSVVREALHRSLSRSRARDCTICFQCITGTSIRVPCGHHYDIPCILNLVRLALRDESSFPPQCCKQAIPVGCFDQHMDPSLAALYTRKSEEYSTLKRVYCANPRCSQFLGPQRVHFSNVYSCTALRCNTRTCSRCKREVNAQGGHSCRADGADKELLSLSKKSGWAQCPGCTRMIELTAGCFHMTCRCKTQFCYLCSSPWKTCQCPRWDEQRLIARAEEHQLAALDMPLRGRTLAARLVEQAQPLAQPHPDIPGPWLLRSRTDPRRGRSAGAVILGASTTSASTSSNVKPSHAPPVTPKPQTLAQRHPITPSRPLLSRALPPIPMSYQQMIAVEVAQEAVHSSDSEAPSVPSPTTKPKPKQPPPQVPRRSPLRTSAPSVLQARESVVARGLDAQRRRTQRSVDLGSSQSRRKDDNPPTPSTPTSIDGIVVDSLESRIDRLLGTVQHYPCQHQWVSQGGRATCDSCYRGGSYVLVCSRCPMRACQRCQTNRI